MRLFGRRQFARLEAEGPRVVAVGSFDGVHLAHRRLIELARGRAEAIGGELVVLTFWPLPGVALGRRGSPRILTSPSKRAEFLAELGVDSLVTLHFDEDLSGMDPGRFVREVLVGEVGVDEICVGFNFSFGHRGCGDAKSLKRYGEEWDFVVYVLSPVQVDGYRVSSTNIRRLIAAGRVHEAGRLLGRPHAVEGKVVKGQGRGRRLGFPTANLRARAGLIAPASGVYAVRAVCPEIHLDAPGVANVGGSPTFHEESGPDGFLEVHVPGFAGDLYGRDLSVEFVRWIRQSRDFADVEELKRQIVRDVASALDEANERASQSLRYPTALC
ncbi:MAG: riboflavin biosynthesis protein RibF [Clostridia bacterium]